MIQRGSFIRHLDNYKVPLLKHLKIYIYIQLLLYPYFKTHAQTPETEVNCFSTYSSVSKNFLTLSYLPFSSVCFFSLPGSQRITEIQPMNNFCLIQLVYGWDFLWSGFGKLGHFCISKAMHAHWNWRRTRSFLFLPISDVLKAVLSIVLRGWGEEEVDLGFSSYVSRRRNRR